MREKLIVKIIQIFYSSLVLNGKMDLLEYFKTYHEYNKDGFYSPELTASKMLSYGFDKLTNKEQKEIVYLQKFYI
jgi:hypothetical protein